MVWWDKGRYTYVRIFVFKSNQSCKSNALRTSLRALAEGEKLLVGHDQEENWSDKKDGYVHLEGCIVVWCEETIGGHWFFILRVSFLCGCLPLCTGYRTREGTIFFISYSATSIIFWTWWMVGVLCGIEKIKHFGRSSNWLIRNRWLNTFRSRDGIGYF